MVLHQELDAGVLVKNLDNCSVLDFDGRMVNQRHQVLVYL